MDAHGWFPSSAVGGALHLTINLPLLTWEVPVVWLVIGMFIYFTYVTEHSKVRAVSLAEAP